MVQIQIILSTAWDAFMQKVAVNDRRIKEMNKIYKVIWSKAKGCYVVVSEIANQNGKSKSSLVNAGMKLSAAVMLALSSSARHGQRGRRCH